MGLNIQNSEGETVFDPSTFGLSDLGKLEAMAEVIRGLLTDVVVKTEMNVAGDFDASAYDLYTRGEVNTMFESYVKYLELTNKIRADILLMIDLGELPSADKVNQMVSTISNLVQANQSLRTDVDSVSSTVQGHSQSIISITNDISDIYDALGGADSGIIEDINDMKKDIQMIKNHLNL